MVAKKNKGGRPTVMTKDVIAKLEMAFSNGMNKTEACLFAGISYDSLYDYEKNNPEFSNKIDLLRSKPDMAARLNVVKKINSGDTDASKWWLERKLKNEFSLRSEHTGAGGDAMQVQLVDDIKEEE